MNSRDPRTWDDLAKHPTFMASKFDPNWYDGDAKEDILRLREATISVLDSLPELSCELIVLDDCTMFVRFNEESTIVCSLYPARTDDYKQCFFVDAEGSPVEMWADTSTDVVRLFREVIMK